MNCHWAIREPRQEKCSSLCSFTHVSRWSYNGIVYVGGCGMSWKPNGMLMLLGSGLLFDLIDWIESIPDAHRRLRRGENIKCSSLKSSLVALRLGFKWRKRKEERRREKCIPMVRHIINRNACELIVIYCESGALETDWNFSSLLQQWAMSGRRWDEALIRLPWTKVSEKRFHSTTKT